MAISVGMANFWYLNAAMHAFIFFCCLFGFPETKWHRTHPNEKRETGLMPSQQASDEKFAVEKTGNNNLEKITTASAMPDLSHTATAARDPWLGRGKPSKQQFKLWTTNSHALKAVFYDLWIPWKLFSFPIVEFASFVVSWSASSFLTLNLTQSQYFAAPPLLYSSNTIGFFNFAILIGMLIGLATAGPLSDWISMRATRRNRGIREPEMRLPSMIPYVIIMMVGNFIVAFGYQNGWDWKVSDHMLHLPKPE